MLPTRTRRSALLVAAALLLAACGRAGTGGSPAAAPDQLTVFAAASLTGAFTELGRRYTAAQGTRVRFNFAGSQALATQLRQGTPADVFASADLANMAKVRDLVGTPRSFASNLLQIVVEKGNPRHVTGLKDLADPGLKVVLAAPDVPAGRYAAQALAKAEVAARPVSQEDNVKAVVAKVALGEADAGIVYVTDVAAGGDKVQGVDIPRDQNVTATYPIATVTAGGNRDKAQAFVDLVLSGQGRQVLRRYGFRPPPTT